MYKLCPLNLYGQQDTVLRLTDNLFIPFNLSNSDYQTYLKWLDGYELQFTGSPFGAEYVKTSDWNTPEPADE